MLKLGVIPSQNLPQKSIHRTVSAPRRPLIRVQKVKDSSQSLSSLIYKNLDDFKTKIKLLKLNDWSHTCHETSVHFQYRSEAYLLPKYEVIVSQSLEFDCLCFGWALPDDHIIYREFRRNIRSRSISSLLNQIRDLDTCKGLAENIKGTVSHTIPLVRNFDQLATGPNQEIFYRDAGCQVALADRLSNICKNCQDFGKKIHQSESRILKNINKPAKKNAPLSVTHRKKVELALIEERQKNKAMAKQIEQMQKEISANSLNVDKTLADDMKTIMDENKENITPFKIFFFAIKCTKVQDD